MKIIIEVPDHDLNWDAATVWPLADDTCGYGWDIDYSGVTFEGKKEGDGWEFLDSDEPADYLIRNVPRRALMNADWIGAAAFLIFLIAAYSLV